MSDPNWSNRTIWTGDNLPIIRGMNSQSVDLIYLDPPFNSNTDYAAPIGSEAAGAEFKDTWTLYDIDEAWLYLLSEKPQQKQLWRVIQAAMNNSDKSYLIYMAVRLLEMKRLLRQTGSIYLHCDPTMSHYLKLLMDSIFGCSNFRNEIVWKRTNAPTASSNQLGRVHDCILFYSATRETSITPVHIPFTKQYIAQRFKYKDSRGQFQDTALTAKGQTNGPSGMLWREIDVSAKGLHWICPTAIPEEVTRPVNYSHMTTQERLDWLDSEDMIFWPKNGVMPRFKRYLSTTTGPRMSDVVTDLPGVQGTAEERTGYPTQKPIALLERIIKASSRKGDVVFDPFCGCATTLVAADRLERQWVGIDISELAVKLVGERIKKDQGMFPNLVARTDTPKRDDLGDIPPYNSLAIKNALYGEQSGDCNGCGTHFQKQHLTVDHIIAQSKGGTDHIENLQLLCGHCNSVKGDRGQEYLLAKLAA